MRQITREDILRIVGRFVQPLYSGAIESVNGMFCTLTGVIPFGSGDTNFRQAFPFGFVSAPIKGVMAYVLNLGGSALAPIILSHLDKMRPTPSGPGESVFYSLASDGSEVAILIRLRNNGTFEINNGVQEWVDLEIERMNFLINARTLTLIGPQPLYDVTGADTLEAIKAKYETFQEGG